MDTNQNRKTPNKAVVGIDVSGVSPIICPYLGMSTDRVTAIAYPHPANLCQRHSPAVNRQLQFQKSFCLSENYMQCQIFRQEDPLPIAKANKDIIASKSGRIALTLSVILALISIIAIISLATMGSGIITAILSFVPG